MGSEMSDYLQIKNGIIDFQAIPVEKIGMAAFCESFQIKTEEVKIIAISPRLMLDDESLFVTLIDASGQLYTIPDGGLSQKTAGKLEEIFELTPILSVEWAKFEYDDHYAKYDKIIFPEYLYWEDLFERDLRWYWRRIVGGFGGKYLYGNFTNKVKAALVT